MSVSKKIVTTPPAWGPLVLCTSLLTFNTAINFKVHGATEKFFSFPFIFSQLIMFCLFLFSCVHYSFTEKYIVVRLLGIPVRRICWREVTHAIYLHTWRENGEIRSGAAPGIIKGSVIAVSLKYCPPFNPKYSVRTSFSLQNPFSSLFIEIPAKSKDEFLIEFQSHFPDLKRQSMEGDSEMPY